VVRARALAAAVAGAALGEERTTSRGAARRASTPAADKGAVERVAAVAGARGAAAGVRQGDVEGIHGDRDLRRAADQQPSGRRRRCDVVGCCTAWGGR
jgi:hypothetical protein